MNFCFVFEHSWPCFFLTAGQDYFPVHEPFVFRINGDTRACVDIPIIRDLVRGEQYEVFVVRVTSTDVAVFADQAVVVILDQGWQ